MRLASFDGGRIGVLTEAGIVEITDLAGVEPGFWPPVAMPRLIADFDRACVLEAVAERRARPLAEVRLETPVPWPNKVIAFPANYHEHIAEMGSGLVSKHKASGQGFFLKANSSLSGPNDPIVLPPLSDREVHHECELAIVIGKGGRGIPREKAGEHIFGFSCLIDMVVRGTEERVMRKSFDSFCPVGPWITMADEVPDFTAIDMSLSVNGALRQAASTADLIVDIPEMIAMASAVMTLSPGDIIATGTPAGVAPVRPGDVVEIEIGGIGAMRLEAVAGSVGNHPVWNPDKALAKV